MNKIKLLAMALSLAFATNASATVYQYGFGEKITGAGPDEANFATLSFDDEVSKFTLSLSENFATFFNTGAFVGSLAVGYETEDHLPVVTRVVAGGGVAEVGVSNGSGPDGDFDFRYTFGGGSDKLTSGETVSWYSEASSGFNKKGKPFTIASFNVESFEEGALHVQGITGYKNTSGWYEMDEVSPVPEVNTSAMMLMGLGLMGFIARRRRGN